MENGVTELHLVSLPKDVKSLRIVEPSYPSRNGKSTRTPSPTKKCQELMYIDDGTSSNSSATSTKEREKQRHLSGCESDKSTSRPVTGILRVCTSDPHVSSPSAPSPSPLPPPPPPLQSTSTSPPLSSPLPPPTPSCHDLAELTPAPSRRLPTVVVLGYQRAVVESQAAAERMHQQQKQQQTKQHKPTGSSHPLDCPLTLSIASSGLIDHGLPTSPHGRNNRVKCSDGLPCFTQSPPPPQSSPTSDDINISPISISPTYSSKTHSSPSSPITMQEASSQDQSASPFTSPPDSSSPLGSSPPDVATLLPRHVAEDAESIAESVYHQPPKAADRSAAYRLARRLFTLDGFKITDVAKHLCKRKPDDEITCRRTSSPSVPVFDDSSSLRLHPCGILSHLLTLVTSWLVETMRTSD
ncbi:unnamed protein product [Rodentolepis nana]|uniref:Uncharacterized protein n=1 Tax=Rodentolepis nana TaxID=102285 RepID=A0A0R3TPI9_RODNA|nr:unnamed protein product [Rodentolepis nana]